MNTLDHLRSNPWFSKLTLEQFAALAALAKRESFLPGTSLVRIGDLGVRYFVIESGTVSLRRTDVNGFEIQVGVIPSLPAPNSTESPITFFGEQMFTTQEPYDYHADAITPVEALVIARDDFDALIRARPDILNAMPFILAAEKKRTQGFRWINSGESVVLVARKHWWALWLKLFPLFIFALVAFIASLLLRNIFPAELMNLVTVAGLGVFAFLIGVSIFDWSNDEYVVTTQRVAHIEREIISLELRETVPIDKILGVSSNRSGVGGFIGVSDLIIQTAGREEGDVTFKTVGNAATISSIIKTQQDRVKARRAAEEREQFRVSVKRELQVYLQPEALAATAGVNVAPPLAKPSWRRVIRELVRSWIGLQIVEPHRVLWRKHWILLFAQTWKWFVALLALDFLLVLIATSLTLRVFASSPVFFFVGIVFFVFAFGGLLWRWEDWRNDTYAVSDKEVIHIERLPFGIKEESTTVPLDQVQDVRVELPNLFATFANFGDLKIETAGKQGQLLFPSIHNPREAQNEIFRRMEAFRRRRAEQESSLRGRSVVDALVAYHHLQQDIASTASKSTDAPSADSMPSSDSGPIPPLSTSNPT